MIHNIRKNSTMQGTLPDTPKDWGQSIDQFGLEFLDSFKLATMKLIQSSKGKGYVRKQCTGCQVSSEIFPSHSRFESSPRNSSQSKLKKENKTLLDIFKFSLKNVVTQSIPHIESSKNNDAQQRELHQHKSSDDTLEL